MATIKTAIALYDGVTAPLQSMHKAMGIVLNSFEAIQRASSNSVDASSIRQAREEWAKAGAAFDSIEQSIRDADNQQRKFNDRIKNGTTAADGLWKKLKGIAATVGGLAATKKIIGISDDLASTRARLNLLVDDGGSVSELEQKIMASAQRSRSAYFDTASAVSKLGLNAGGAFDHDMNQVIAFMEQVNKQFVIGGATAQEQSNAMVQLTQAMAAGALRGEELNSILDGAPRIARAIEQYMGVAEGSIKQYAEQGLVTAEVVKNALFDMADETNAKFESMPKTWAQIWTSMQNKALSIFNPILTKINQIANSEKFTQVTDGIINGLAGIASVATIVLDLMINGASWVVDNWGWIAPIIAGVATAYLVLHGVMLAYNTVTAISNALETIKAARLAMTTIATGAQTTATFAQTAAQYGLNAAMLACPITWIIMGIIALIAVFYAAVAAVNHFAGTSVSATGIIAGTFTTLIAHILNSFVIPLQNAIASLVNFIGNAFNDPVEAVKVLFYDMCLTVIGYIKNLAQGIEDLLNKIPGITVDITSGLDNFYAGLQQAQQSVKDRMGWVEYMKKWDYIDYSSAASAGYEFGQGVEKQIGGLFDFSSMDSMGAGNDPFSFGNTLDGIYNNTGDIATNTADTADALDMSNEELELLRDIAERKAINEYTTAEIKVEMNNSNTISSEMDIDGVINLFEVKLREAVATSAEGAHI